jgi:hypothetical protein
MDGSCGILMIIIVGEDKSKMMDGIGWTAGRRWEREREREKGAGEREEEGHESLGSIDL